MNNNKTSSPWLKYRSKGAEKSLNSSSIKYLQMISTKILMTTANPTPLFGMFPKSPQNFPPSTIAKTATLIMERAPHLRAFTISQKRNSQSSSRFYRSRAWFQRENGFKREWLWPIFRLNFKKRCSKRRNFFQPRHFINTIWKAKNTKGIRQKSRIRSVKKGKKPISAPNKICSKKFSKTSS